MWAYEGIFYQIYPIGFCGAPTANDGKTVSRILKLKDWSSYLESLGISSILLNPIFESDNHGYDTRDYKKIDCRLGTNEDFAEVCKYNTFILYCTRKGIKNIVLFIKIVLY